MSCSTSTGTGVNSGVTDCPSARCRSAASSASPSQSRAISAAMHSSVRGTALDTSPASATSSASPQICGRSRMVSDVSTAMISSASHRYTAPRSRRRTSRSTRAVSHHQDSDPRRGAADIWCPCAADPRGRCAADPAAPPAWLGRSPSDRARAAAPRTRRPRTAPVLPGHRGAVEAFRRRHARASRREAQTSDHEVLTSVQELTNGVEVAGMDGGFDQDVHQDGAQIGKI